MADRQSLRASPPRFVDDPDFVLYVGDARDVLPTLPAESVDCCVTSPPYWGLRDYRHETQIGLEQTPDEYVDEMVAVFAVVRRLLKPTGVLWLNLGDSYNVRGPKGLNGHDKSTLTGGGPSYQRDVSRSSPRVSGLKPKDLIGIPWRVAFALQQDGWWLRSDVVWSKPNPMPESVTDRPTKAHEYVFLLSKGPRYFYDADAIAEPAAWERWGDQTVGPGSNPDGWIKPKTKQQLTGESRPPGRGDTYSGFNERYAANDPVARKTRNARTVWEIAAQPYPEAHFATFPEELPRRCIAAGCPAAGVVLDPFMGSGTTALVARKLGRKSVGVELSPDYARLCADRLSQLSLLAEGVA